MPRTTPELVAGVIEVDPTIPVDPFILIANELVTEVCVPLGYSDSRLELIERWLSAHFYGIRDKQVASEKAGDVSASYQHELGLNLANTMHGQQAMVLDTLGGLAQLNKATEEGKPRTATVLWLGRKC